MKRFIALIMFAATMVGCSYNDHDLWDEISDIKQRLDSLEDVARELNSQMGELRKMVDALSKGKVVLNVQQTADGYILEMSDGSKIEIRNGKDGKDGQDGQDGKDGTTPVIGAKQGEDGIWYWTVNGEILKDSDGNPIPVQGEKGAAGEDGKTPQIGVREDTDGELYWTVDGEWLLDSGGNKVKAQGHDGKDGESGDSIFQKVEQDDKNVTITLADGSVIILPKLADAKLKFTDEKDLVSYWGDSVTLSLETENIISASVTFPDGWNGRVNLTTSKAVFTAPWVTDDCETEGYVGIIAVTDRNQTIAITKKCKVGTQLALNEKYKSYGDLMNHIVDDILPQRCAAHPWDAVLDIPEVMDSYCALKLTSLTRAMCPSLTINTHGSSAQFNVGSSSPQPPYDGTITITAGEGEKFTTAGYIYPRNAFVLLEADFERISGAYPYSLMVGKSAHIEYLTVSTPNATVMNLGYIGTLNSTSALSYVNFGTIAEQAGKGTKSEVKYRPATTASTPYIGKVLRYRPAPGQYGSSSYASIGNEGGLVTYSSIGGTLKSLGMFGGEVVFQFDHTLFNFPGYDFVIRGNAMATANEPGIVEVSYDANHNGIADDEWYELAGSLYNDAQTIKGYELTYILDKENNCIRWKDNQGADGTIGINGTNKPATWWPGISETTLTVKGTLVGKARSMYYPIYDYGYADTYSPLYTVKLDGDSDTSNTNKFDLDWAVDSAGKSVRLAAVDFIRVYNCVFTIDQDYPAFGEVSTEIAGAKDLGFKMLPKSDASAIDNWTNGSSF